MADISERFIAKVAVNEDPDKRGRIQVTCPDLTGDPEAVLPEWIEPVHQWGWFYVPDVDELVEVEVITATDHDEVPGQSLVMAPTLKWRGHRFLNDNEERGVVRDVHDDLKTNYGKRRGFVTPRGHTFIFDDKEGSDKIQLSLRTGADGSEKYFQMTFEDGEIKIIAPEGTVNVEAETVVLGEAATESAMLGDKWRTIFGGHKHPSGTGPTGEPIPNTPENFDNALSESVTVRS